MQAHGACLCLTRRSRFPVATCGEVFCGDIACGDGGCHPTIPAIIAGRRRALFWQLWLRYEIPEDYTRTQRWRATAETSLPGRKWLVRQCGQTSLKCTTCTPGESDSTLPDPRGHGEYPPGAHVVAVRGSPGDRVGQSVSRIVLPKRVVRV